MLIKKITKKAKSDTGAIDKVLVTLLFVIVAVISLISLEGWTSNQKQNLINSSENAISIVNNETKY